MASNQQDFDAVLDQLHSVVQDFISDVKNFMERAEQGQDFSQEIAKLKTSITALEDADSALTGVQETQPTDGAPGEDTATGDTGTDTPATGETTPTDGQVVTEPQAPDATDTQPVQ